jgi:hypothetical protein
LPEMFWISSAVTNILVHKGIMDHRVFVTVSLSHPSLKFADKTRSLSLERSPMIIYS